MGTALSKLSEEDPTFRAHTDQETGQTIIAGMGELHLDIIVDRMRREFKVEANVGAPQVAYRETFRAAAKVEGKFARQSVVVDNSVTFGLSLNLTKKVKDSNSKTRSSVV